MGEGDIMETCKRMIDGKKDIVIHPILAEHLLQINKKAKEIKDLVKKVIDMVGEGD